MAGQQVKEELIYRQRKVSFDDVPLLLKHRSAANTAMLLPIEKKEATATANSLDVKGTTFKNPLTYTLGDVGKALRWKKRIKP